MTIRIAAFAGSLSRPSRTAALVETAAARTAARFGGTAETHDLTDLQPALGQAATLGDLASPARTIVERIIAADALIVGSPVYKGSYTGLFKHLFDLLDPADLAGKPVLLTATGGGDRHALVIEHQLRPLFGFFEAAVLPTGVYACGADFRDGQPVSQPLLERLDRAVAQFAPWLDRPAHATASAA